MIARVDTLAISIVHSSNSTGATSPHGEMPLVDLRDPSPMKTKAAKRFKWSNDMIGMLLRLHFADGDVKRRLESAQTKTQIALAWQCANPAVRRGDQD
ncbi:hypothetical protein PF005_g5873 [Phytophthora fragariae]|uniref:Uncharacterized protein n=2 Tax=Phytophthora TaxID=4783 RepID=A0A6A3LFQ9_9STRA|nr:hypothetical protein PF003_g19359 [Phytophthora fragariae]KAE9016884.1 hypothetical protein PR001_g14536 [Phytophthora rubi]KAE8943898.1 hypothetical protein PF009_g6393 [Phytophthora fragariae]KAE9014663.1 hypothetical protein PF011_g7956 [Phytophthora fragariae]KAE9032251.1 hypothetical protein PR002_g9270 [Phytophthora rubi]